MQISEQESAKNVQFFYHEILYFAYHYYLIVYYSKPQTFSVRSSYSNAYTPDYPYVVEMAASANKPQMTWDNEEVTFIYTFGFGGWDSFQRSADVTKKSTGLYQLTNCPSYYTQCKNIVGTWKGLK